MPPKKNTSETLVLQRYAEIVPSVNRTAVVLCWKAASLRLPSYPHAKRSRNFRSAVLVARTSDTGSERAAAALHRTPDNPTRLAGLGLQASSPGARTWLRRHYPASALIRTHPPPSRLRSTSRLRRYTIYLAPVISPLDEEGFASYSACPRQRAVAWFSKLDHVRAFPTD